MYSQNHCFNPVLKNHSMTCHFYSESVYIEGQWLIDANGNEIFEIFLRNHLVNTPANDLTDIAFDEIKRVARETGLVMESIEVPHFKKTLLEFKSRTCPKDKSSFKIVSLEASA